MIYDFVPFHLVAEDIAKNIEQHYQDVSLKDDYGWPEVDWESYIQLSLGNKCYAVICRDEDRLVAYSVFCVSNNLNHKNIIEAANTAMFIDKKYRGKMVLELLRKTDEFLKEISVREIIYITNDSRIGALLKRTKYKAKHILWSKQYA